MRKYETLMALHPELPAAQIRETIDRVKRLIEGMHGEVQQVQEWGIRDLAYKIKKCSRGYYVLTEYTAKPDVVLELERTLKIADEVLRFVSVAAPRVARADKKTKKSPEQGTAVTDQGEQPLSAD